ncbi:DNA/RNA non-specific endonuclease [Mucilaginibacter jinjuensis]|uniref:DNA/RNA non-specific endonuclease n=1 Tax=Mucilaginibacter jinjuensis TaxID=1176721 RepID=A0ABY7T7R4_9SPHI|nr:DNA/RNA non-specific endonuclease [Mucilaginibacter jinjuensis]WCT12318.1 DNA/RNA non-specific endonuclease [Mucilaginibacter jinjuensis]
MKIKNLLFIVAISLFAFSCKKDNKNDASTTPTNGNGGTGGATTPPTVINYSITENFDTGTKTGYAIANVTLSTGSWSFDNALLGNLAADLKNGAQSVRMKSGAISMNFDINGLKTLYIKHGKYGTDATSTWQLLKSTDGGTTYTQVGSDISETNTTLKLDSFQIAATGKVRIQIKDTNPSTSTARINIDDIVFKGTGDPGITVGVPDTNPVDTAGTTTPAASRGVTVGTDAPPATGDNSDLLFGNPSGATTSAVTSADNYLIDQGYYVESYNNTKAEPNWVSWHLDNSNTTNQSARLNNFAAFSGLPTGFYAVQSTSYSGSGFDRGHNCPSADRTSSTNANSATFLMTNMIPQAPQNNQQTWANLENYLRTLTDANYEVYIIMGSYGSGGSGSQGGTTTSINGGKVNVPSNVWKVAIVLPKGDGDLSRVTSSTRVIAVNTPNINTINSDWTKYIVTVRDIEKATGYNLFSALPQSVQDAIETKTDSGS